MIFARDGVAGGPSNMIRRTVRPVGRLDAADAVGAGVAFVTGVVDGLRGLVPAGGFFGVTVRAWRVVLPG